MDYGYRTFSTKPSYFHDPKPARKTTKPRQPDAKATPAGAATVWMTQLQPSGRLADNDTKRPSLKGNKLSSGAATRATLALMDNRRRFLSTRAGGKDPLHSNVGRAEMRKLQGSGGNGSTGQWKIITTQYGTPR